MKYTFRRITLFFAAVMLLVGVQARPAAAQSKIVLTYWIHNNPPAIPINQQIVDEFMKENPNIEVQVDSAPHANFEQKVLTAFAGNAGPDVWWMGDWMVPQLVAGKLVAPVDPTAYGVKTQDEFVKLFAPGSLDAFTVDGKVYTGGTSEFNTFSLIYNVDHFKEAGIALPSKDKPMTWEELADIAAKLTKTDGGKVTRVGIEWPFTTPIWSVLIAEPMVRQQGGEIVDLTTGKAQFNTAAMLNVMKYMKSLNDKKAIDTAFYTDLLADFGTGRASMIIGGPWAVVPLKTSNPNTNWDTAPLPQFKDAKARVTTMYAWAWFVNAQSSPEKQAAAWKLVEKLTSKSQPWWDKVGYVQARTLKADNGKDMVEYRTQTDPRLKTIFDDYPFGKFEFRSTKYFEVSDILNRALTRVLNGEDPQKVMDEAQAAANFTLN
jgi:multiple sugar transport system substrate-binding protein